LRGGQKLVKNSKKWSKIPKNNKIDQKMMSKIDQKTVKKSEFLMAKLKNHLKSLKISQK